MVEAVQPDWRVAPHQLRAALRAYYDFGDSPRSRFLDAVLANDLRGAVFATDAPLSLAHVHEVLRFLSDEFPEQIWGSREALANWAYLGGRNGQRRMLAEYATGSALPPREHKFPKREVNDDADDAAMAERSAPAARNRRA
jgi:hypothetical protein